MPTQTAVRLVRFNELGPNEVNRDLQIHTQATDGEATVEEIITRAEALGLEEIAFTEHVRRESDYAGEFLAHVRRARAATRVRVHVGFEVKAADAAGTLDITEPLLAEAEIILGSVHRFPEPDGRLVPASALAPAEAARREYELALALVWHAPIHVLAHPGGMCQKAFGLFPDEYFEGLMRATLDRGIAIEINTSYTRDLDRFLGLCRKVNPVVSIGSDVHRLADLGQCRDALRERGIGCR